MSIVSTQSISALLARYHVASTTGYAPVPLDLALSHLYPEETIQKWITDADNLNLSDLNLPNSTWGSVSIHDFSEKEAGLEEKETEVIESILTQIDLTEARIEKDQESIQATGARIDRALESFK